MTSVGIWRNPFGIALLFHLVILAALGYALHAGAKKEIQYIEVTMEELFAAPSGGGGRQRAQDNMPQMTQQTVAAPTMENIAQLQQSAESAVADIPTLALTSSGMSTGDNGTGQGTGEGSGGGTGTGQGPGQGSGGGMKQRPSVISGSKPAYPSTARQNGWEGTVKVSVVISEDGRVQEASVASSSGHDVLDQAAVRAMYKWRFRPALDDYGQPVNMEITVPVRFNLEEAD